MATAAGRAGALNDNRFFTITALAMVVVIFVGFAPSFYLRGLVSDANRTISLTPLVIAHGLVFTAWLGFYVAQVWLAATGRIALHRRMGQLGWVFLPLLVVMGVVTALYGVARASGPPGIPPLSWLATPLLDVPVYGLLIGLALREGTRRPVHKRLMYLALATMMVPGFGRIPVPPQFIPVMTIVLPALFVVALIGWDIYSRGRPMRVTMVAGGGIIALWLVKPLIWGTAAWLAFAGWVSAPFT